MCHFSNTVWWLLLHIYVIIDCDVSFVEVTKHAPLPRIHTYFLEIQDKYSFAEVIIEASKSNSLVSYAVVGQLFSEAGVLHSDTSSFTEAYIYNCEGRQPHQTDKCRKGGNIHRFPKCGTSPENSYKHKTLISRDPLFKCESLLTLSDVHSFQCIF